MSNWKPGESFEIIDIDPDTVGCIYYLRMPEIPKEVFEWLEETMSKASALTAWQSSNGDATGSDTTNTGGRVTKPGAAARLPYGSESQKVANTQVSHPSAGGQNHEGKDSANNEDALGKPGRFTRTAPVVATPRPDSKLQETRDRQLGTNIELNWKRYGHDQMSPKGNQDFKKNFSNPTDNSDDLTAKQK